MGRLRSELAYTTVSDIMNAGLHEFLDALQIKMNETGDAIYESFIALDAEKSTSADALLIGA